MKNKLFILIAVIAVVGVLLCVVLCGGGDHEKSTDGKATGVEDSEGVIELASTIDKGEIVATSEVFLMDASSGVSEVSSEPSAVYSKSVDKVMKSVAGLETSGKAVLGGRRGKAKASMAARVDKEMIAVGPKPPIIRPDRHDDMDGANDRKSGLLTAGEWNDLDNWKFWTDFLNENNYSGKMDYWKFFPKNLLAVRVVDGNNNGFANVTVELFKGDSLEFATKTDNAGYAYCWISLFNDAVQDFNAKGFSLRVSGKRFKGPFKLTTLKDEKLNLNVIFTKEFKHSKAKADVAFIVDATGSMKDEINFLKSDLGKIIEHASAESKVSLRTAALFYRDVGDVYITRHDNFTNDVSKTQAFIAKQDADGGGDYPEAVHTALEASMQNLSWDESARSRIAFLILDAPAHYEEGIIKSLQKSILLFAQKGIKVIPVAASGADKDTEFMLRFFDLATGGTYVFLTDDSGIGNSHIKASVGDHKVESLADIMVRLIKKYVK